MRHASSFFHLRTIVPALALAAAPVHSGPAPLAAQDGAAYRFAFGRQQHGGELGKILDPGTDAEFSILVPVKGLRVGAGANWASFDVGGVEASWNQIRFHGLLGYRFSDGATIRPYAEARYVFRRLRPEDRRFFDGAAEEELLRDFKTEGSGFEGVVGVEVGLTERLALDLSGAAGGFSLSPDLESEGLGPVDGGSSWRFQAGVTWFPTSGRGGETATGADAGDAEPRLVGTDAWGQPRNFGLAAVGTLMGNVLPWTVNEILPGRAALKISQLSPRSWWRNLEAGWKWDDNAFQVNHFAHPFQGNIYFNAARSNGYGYWPSLLFATAGSFQWECCGETHLMSINDWVNTSIGGAAVGEMLYRTSSMILDNQATGAERGLREAAAFLLNPTRGFTRLVTGNATRVYANPTDPRDHVPDHLEMVLSAGVRAGDAYRKARGGRLDDEFPAHGFLDVSLISGSLAELDRQKPFDWFRMGTQLEFIRGRWLGEIRIQGNLWHRNLGASENSSSRLVLLQDFLYENSPAFENGGQSVALAYHRLYTPSDRSRHEWRAAGIWTLLGGVSSELAFLAEVEGIRERYREYDFGVGPGAELEYGWTRDGLHVLSGSYRVQHLSTLNGATGEDFGTGHLLQTLRLRGVVPIPWKQMGVGVNYELFHRRSDFEVEVDGEPIGTLRQRGQQWQFFLTWSPERGR